MAFRYVVKKRMVGIGTKTEKYVAASYSVANIDFDRLCDQVTSQGMVPRGIVKAVLDGMIDALCTYASIGATVRLGDFGSLRPGLNGKSQEDAKSVTADVVYRQKLIFVPGQRLKNMMKQSGITRLVTEDAVTPLTTGKKIIRVFRIIGSPEAVQITQAVILSTLHHHTNTITYFIIARQSLPIPHSQSVRNYQF